jgi:hypothetical protein
VLSPRQLLTATPYAIHAQDGWSVTGNAGTTPGTNFLGTTDNHPLVIKTNGTEVARVGTDGHVAIGTTGTSAGLEASMDGIAVMGTSNSRGVIGRIGVISCPGTYGVGGCASGDATGVSGASDSGRAVQGFSNTGIGVIGNSTTRGVVGTLGGTSCAGTYAVGGCATGGDVGVSGASDSGIGVSSSSDSGRAVQGFSNTGIGVIGDSTTRGVVGTLDRASCAGTYGVGGCVGSDTGVLASSGSGVALLARTTSGAIFVGQSPSGTNQARIDNTGRGFFNNGTQSGGADFAESLVAGV